VIDSDSAGLLVDLTQVVMDDPDPYQFLAHLTNVTLAPLEARGAILGVVEHEGFLDLKGVYGYSKVMVERYTKIPLWISLPITDAARLGNFSIFNSPQEMIGKYPQLKDFNDVEVGVTISAPVKYRSTTLGAIGFTLLNTPSKGFETSDNTKALLSICGLYLRNYMARTVERDEVTSSTFRTLTPRQKEIINLFKQELTTDQMAERLNYSSSTIKQDIIKIYSIFGVNTRASVVEIAEKVGLS
jgi:DNA-binding CsgD family transcriptional regulator